MLVTNKNTHLWPNGLISNEYIVFGCFKNPFALEYIHVWDEIICTQFKTDFLYQSAFFPVFSAIFPFFLNITWKRDCIEFSVVKFYIKFEIHLTAPISPLSITHMNQMPINHELFDNMIWSNIFTQLNCTKYLHTFEICLSNGCLVHIWLIFNVQRVVW